jgi:hypothetical protein
MQISSRMLCHDTGGFCPWQLPQADWVTPIHGLLSVSSWHMPLAQDIHLNSPCCLFYYTTPISNSTNILVFIGRLLFHYIYPAFSHSVVACLPSLFVAAMTSRVYHVPSHSVHADNHSKIVLVMHKNAQIMPPADAPSLSPPVMMYMLVIIYYSWHVIN